MSNDNDKLPEDIPTTAEHTHLAKGVYAQFFERNKAGIQYVNVESHTYYISRRWTLRGPIPPGAKIEHTGLAGYKDDSIYDARGFKRLPRERTGGSKSKRHKRR